MQPLAPSTGRWLSQQAKDAGGLNVPHAYLPPVRLDIALWHFQTRMVIIRHYSIGRESVIAHPNSHYHLRNRDSRHMGY